MTRNEYLENELARLEESNRVIALDCERLNISLSEKEAEFRQSEQTFRKDKDRLLTAAHHENEQLTAKLHELEEAHQLSMFKCQDLFLDRSNLEIFYVHHVFKRILK